MEEYTVILRVNTEWIGKWCGVPEEVPTTREQLQLWMEIATSGTGISIESVSKTEE